MTILCRLGWHHDIVHEDSSFKRIAGDHGETIDAHSIKECSCGAVIETETHSVNSSTITLPNEHHSILARQN